MVKFRAVSSPVSPEFGLRPSLSDHGGLTWPSTPTVSPEFGLRPSLSVGVEGEELAPHRGVAGVWAPAFVERLLAITGLAAERECRRSLGSGLR